VQVQAQILMKSKVLVKNGFMSDKEIRAAHYEPVADVSKECREAAHRRRPRVDAVRPAARATNNPVFAIAGIGATRMSLDVETHEPHAHKTGHKWVDLTVAFSALLLSVVSLGIAIMDGRTMEKMADANARMVAANSWPSLYGAGTGHLQRRRHDQYARGQHGRRSAKIESAELVWKGVAYRSDQDFLKACCDVDPSSINSIRPFA